MRELSSPSPRSGPAVRRLRDAGDARLAHQVMEVAVAHGEKGLVTVQEVEDPRLLGGQIIGNEGAGLRINVLAGALHSGMTVEQLSRFDLAYMPSMSPVWDPLLVAANVALKG